MEGSVVVAESMRNPYAEMSERPEKRRTLEIVAPETKKGENEMVENTEIKEEEKIIEPNCTYAECMSDNKYCDLCKRTCNGVIMPNIKKSSIMDESKVCMKMNATNKDSKAENIFVKPVVYTVTQEEAKKLSEFNKVAYIEINLNEVKPVNNSVRIFFGVRKDEA